MNMCSHGNTEGEISLRQVSTCMDCEEKKNHGEQLWVFSFLWNVNIYIAVLMQMPDSEKLNFISYLSIKSSL